MQDAEPGCCKYYSRTSHLVIMLAAVLVLAPSFTIALVLRSAFVMTTPVLA